MSHVEFVKPLTRYARTVRHPDLVLQELDEAVSRALVHGGEPGPAYLDFPVDTLRAHVSPAVQLDEFFQMRVQQKILPELAAAQAVMEILWQAKRPLVIS